MRRVLWAAIATSAAALSFAGAASAKTATIGSTSASGSPSNGPGGCISACTDIPFSNVSAPTLVVPFDGKVTSYSLNEGSTGNPVRLRVLRSAGGGNFTAISSSPTHATAGTLESISVSLPVKKGDVLGLDVENSGLVFDDSSTTALDAYYAPPIHDGSTAAPTADTGHRLLMSAVIQSTGSTPLPPGTHAPKISNAHLTHKRFHVGKGRRSPRGTAFKFTLSNAANVQIVIARLVPGLRKGGRCVKPTHKLRSAHAKRCSRSARVGKLTRTNLAQGAATIKFTGRLGSKALKPGRYSATLTATNSAGRSEAVTLRFRVVRK